MPKKKSQKTPINTDHQEQKNISLDEKIKLLRQNVILKAISDSPEEFFSAVKEYLNFLPNSNLVDQDKNILVITQRNYLTKLKNLNNFDNYQTHISNIKQIINKINDPTKISAQDIVTTLQPYDYSLFKASSKNGLTNLKKLDIESKIGELKSFYQKILDKKIISDYQISEFINDAILKGSFLLTDSAKSRLILDNSKKQNAFKTTILTNIINGITSPLDIPDILELFKINLSEISVPWKPDIYHNTYTLTSTSFVIKALNKIWQDQPERAKELLDAFVLEHRLDLNAPFKQNNALTLAMEEVNGLINLDLIELLLKHGANPNQVMSDALENSVQKFTTMAFPVAIGSTNYDLIKLLLEYGADPYLPSIEAHKILHNMNDDQFQTLLSGSQSYNTSLPKGTSKDDINTEEIDLVLLTCGLKNKISEAEKQEEYFIALDQFIDNFFASKIANLIIIKAPQEQEHNSQTHKVITTNQDELVNNVTPKEEEHLKSLPLDHIDDRKLPSDALVTTIQTNYSNDTNDKKASTDHLIERYIQYKQNAQIDKNLPEERQLEHKFDALLLQFINGNNDALSDINSMLAEYPDLSGYSIAALLKGYSQETVDQILSYHPKLLNQYFLEKKLHQDHTKNTKTNMEKSLGDRIYEVEGRFSGAQIFIKVPEEYLNHSKLEKIKVISKDSKGINGIKFEPGSIKLKLGRNDDALYSQEIIKDEKGRIFIEFTETHNHAWAERQKGTKLTTITLNEKEFDSQIFYGDWVDLGNEDYTPESDIPDSMGLTGYNPDINEDFI